MHLNYSARDAGGTLRVGAEKAIGAALNKILKAVADSPTGLVRAFSLRREFPDAFHRLLTNPNPNGEPLQILPEHFPFSLRSIRPELTFLEDGKVDVHAISKAEVDPSGIFGTTTKIGLAIVDPSSPPTSGPVLKQLSALS